MDKKRAAAANLIEQLKEQERRDKIERYKRLNGMVRKGQILFCGSSLMEEFPMNQKVMNEPQYKSNANQVSDSFKACGGAAEAKTFLEQIAGQYG